MKRFFYIFTVLFICGQNSFAQIQIEEYGKASSIREYEEELSSIYWLEDGYYFSAWDYDCAKYNLVGADYCVLIYLGANKEEVKRSKKFLKTGLTKQKIVILFMLRILMGKGYVYINIIPFYIVRMATNICVKAQ